MELLHKTVADAPISEKLKVFVHTMPGDELLRDRVVDLILKSGEGNRFAVFYLAGGPGFPLDLESPELSRMNLFVPLVTKTYLKECPSDFSLDRISADRNTPVLPVLDSAATMPAYSQRFDRIQIVSLSMKDPELEIEKQLQRLLLKAELNEQIIRDAFTRQLFISYRKKDKAEIESIMRAVRATRWAASAAFWFDDYLVPGTDFVEGINRAMDGADAIVMAVTPNLPALNDQGQKNYVVREEYRRAIDLKKPIIAVEAVPTKRAALDAEFPAFPECIPVQAAEKLDEAFDALGAAEAEADPHISYLRAMAFLYGVRVEKDVDRAIRMLKDCADRGVPEAAMQLCYMHSLGICLPHDLDEAAAWKQRAFRIVEAWEDGAEKLRTLANILFMDPDDPEAEIGTTPQQADPYYASFLEIAERCETEDKAGELARELPLWKAQAHLFLGSVENRLRTELIDRGTEYFRQHLDAAGKLLDHAPGQDGRDFLRISAAYHSLMASWYRQESQFEKALDAARKAAKRQKQLVELEPTFKARWQLVSYEENVTGCKYLFEKARHNLRYPLIGMYSDVRNTVKDYEALYGENKHPQLAAELVGAYRNLALAFNKPRKIAQQRRKAGKRLREVQREYPENRNLQNLKQAMRAEKKSAPQTGLAHGLGTAVHLLICLSIVGLAFLLLSGFIGSGTRVPYGRLLPYLPLLLLALAGGIWQDRQKRTGRLFLVSLIAVVSFVGLMVLLKTLDNAGVISIAGKMGPMGYGLLVLGLLFLLL